MKKILTLALLFVSLLTMAVPAKPGAIEIVQPDGTTLEILLFGDENFNYVTTTDGYLIKQNSDGYYMYARYEDGLILTTELYARNISERQDVDLAFLNEVGPAELKKAELTEIWEEEVMARMQITPQHTSQSLNTTAELAQKGLVVLVEFSDLSFTHSTQDFDDLLNLEGYSYNDATGCASEYFRSVSNGQYDPHFDVFGPVTLDNDLSYYGAPKDGSTIGDALAPQMFVDAIAKLKSDPNVSLDLSDYDSDGDGYVDDVFLFFAGFSEAEGASSNAIWPHRWAIYTYKGEPYNFEGGVIEYDGVELSGYACTSELKGTSGTTRAGIGVFCHEFSHVLGLPDFYSTASTSHKTCGMWDLMDYGSYNNDSRTPPSYSAHERFYVGWLTPTVINSGGDFELEDIQTSNTAYMITSTGAHNLKPTDPNPSEYYLLENRQLTGWDSYLPGSGMMLTKTSYSSSLWSSNDVNVDPDAMGYDIIEADGLDADSYYFGKAGDLFPGTSNVTSYQPYPRFSIADIAETNGVITFSIIEYTEHSVAFDAKEFGVANKSALIETTVGGGVTLPGVTVTDEEYTFIGWSENYDPTDVDAGLEDEIYYPTKDITLYAVYAKDGEIVGFEGERPCFEETFDNFTTYSTTDLSSDLDTYCDNTGWLGEQISSYRGSARVGLSNVDGYLTSPRFLFTSNITVTITCRGNSSGTLSVAIDGTDTEKTVSISSTETEYTIEFEDFALLSRLKFSSTTDQLFINYLAVCPEGVTVAVDEVSETESINLIYGENKLRILENLPISSTVQCFDVAGRMLWSEVANSTQMTFSAPNGFYLIRVVDGNNQETVIKGL
ncbi:MAG: M6 family metalloprotease domain-containing protein [bacterium]